MANIYRKESLDRISAPEKLDDYIKVSNPSIWVIILSMFILLGGFGYWCMAGRLPTTIKGNGVVSSSSADIVKVFVSQESLSKLSTMLKDGEASISDMEVRVSPMGMPSKYGHLIGKISKIGSAPMSEDAIAESVKDNYIAKSVVPEGGYGILVEVQLQRDEKSPKLLKWSGDASDGGAKLLKDTICEVSIVIQEDTPISFLFG